MWNISEGTCRKQLFKLHIKLLSCQLGSTFTIWLCTSCFLMWYFGFLFFIFLMLYVWMKVGGRRRSTGCFLSIILYRIFETISVTDPGAHRLSQTDGTASLSRTHLSLPCTQTLKLQMHVATPGFYMGTRDLNVGPLACTTSTLLQAPTNVIL